MQLAIDQKDIDKFLMVGDKVLIKPRTRRVRQIRIVSAAYRPAGEDSERLYHQGRSRFPASFPE